MNRVYRMESVYKTYEAKWKPIKDEPWWLLAPLMTLVPNPSLRRHRGWSKSTKVRNEMDWTKLRPRERCSCCKQIRHNSRRCHTRISSSVNDGERPSSWSVFLCCHLYYFICTVFCTITFVLFFVLFYLYYHLRTIQLLISFLYCHLRTFYVFRTVIWVHHVMFNSWHYVESLVVYTIWFVLIWQ